MKREIRETKTNGIIQVTTYDERWYYVNKLFVPSVTWVASCYPKGYRYYRWLASKGWDEAEAIKSAAGDKGSRVHHAIDALLHGGTVNMDSRFPDSNGIESELTVEDWECLMSFHAWYRKTKPQIIQTEQVVVHGSAPLFAGTLDLKCKIDGEIWIVDFKTGQSVWPEYEVQVNLYGMCEGQEDVLKLGILQIGYRSNRVGYKFNEIERDSEIALAACTIWKKEHGKEKPRQRDYPAFLTLLEEAEPFKITLGE